jgi:serine/threonine protein kinase
MLGADDSETQEQTLVAGTLLDRWRIVRLLGRGGMSMVYEAEHRNGARVAIKVLDATLARNARARERFLREGRVANSVDHPNAVRVLDEHEVAGTFFLVLDLLDGETLRDACKAAGGRLDVTEALRVANAVLEVLVAAHAKGIIHRDIKPQNVFLTTQGAVKVLDFGVAAVRDAASADSAITQSGMALGTPAFMAPEQARGQLAELDARTDVWAVGATLFWCLTGRHVHQDASTLNEALIFAATQPAQPVSKFRPDLPREVAVVVDRALAFNPADRFPSASAMRRAILEATAPPAGLRALETPGSWTAETLPSSETRLVARRLPRRVPVLVATLAISALTLFLIHRRSPASANEAEPRPASAERFQSTGSDATRANEAPAAPQGVRTSDGCVSPQTTSEQPAATDVRPRKANEKILPAPPRARTARAIASSHGASTAEQPHEPAVHSTPPEARAEISNDIPEAVLDRRR